MTLHMVRLVAGAIALGALASALWWRAPVARALRRYFGEPTSASSLGALRVFIFAKLFAATDPGAASQFAALPAAFRRLPFGWRWLGDAVPFDPGVAHAAAVGVLVTSGMAALGLFTRWTTSVAAVLSVYVLGLANCFAKINHKHHAVVLCALVLAAAPSGVALSLDRLWQRSRGQAHASYRAGRPRSTGERTGVMLETRDGERDLSEPLRFLGVPRLVVLLRKLKAATGDPERQATVQAQLRALIETSGVQPEPGARLTIHRMRWDLFPLGERAHARCSVIDAFVVTNDGLRVDDSIGRRRRHTHPPSTPRGTEVLH
jgi:hypothetical protein